MAPCLACPKLLFNSIPVKRCTHNVFRGPVMVVGNDDVFPHHGLKGGDFRMVFSKAHCHVLEPQLVAFVAHIELVAELAVAPDNGGTLPIAFLVIVFSTIFDLLGPDPLKFPRKIVELLSHGGRIEGHHHRTSTASKSLGGAEGTKPIALLAGSGQLAVFLNIERDKVPGIDSGKFLSKVGGNRW
jgi:hypothetical protein